MITRFNIRMLELLKLGLLLVVFLVEPFEKA